MTVLCQILAVSIAKVLSLRISRGEKFFPEHFGHVLWRDTDNKLYLSEIKTSLGDILVTKACKDIWVMIDNINDLATAMKRLIHVVERLMHHKVLLGSALSYMWEWLEGLHNRHQEQGVGYYRLNSAPG